MRLFSSILTIIVVVFWTCKDSSTEPVLQDPPAAPGIDSVTTANGMVTVYWNNVDNAESYTVFRDTTAGVTDSSEQIPAGTVNKLSQAGLKNGVTYYFRVAAVNSDGLLSKLSNELAGTPFTDKLSVPKYIKITETDTSSITVSWGASSGATRYTLFWSTSSGVADTSSKISDITTLSYKHTGLSKDSTYYYRVSAQNDDTITSALTEEIEGTPKESKKGGDDKGGKGCTEGDVIKKEGYGTWKCKNGKWVCIEGDCKKDEGK